MYDCGGYCRTWWLDGTICSVCSPFSQSPDHLVLSMGQSGEGASWSTMFFLSCIIRMAVSILAMTMSQMTLTMMMMTLMNDKCSFLNLNCNGFILCFVGAFLLFCCCSTTCYNSVFWYALLYCKSDCALPFGKCTWICICSNTYMSLRICSCICGAAIRVCFAIWQHIRRKHQHAPLFELLMMTMVIIEEQEWSLCGPLTASSILHNHHHHHGHCHHHHHHRHRHHLTEALVLQIDDCRASWTGQNPLQPSNWQS